MTTPCYQVYQCKISLNHIHPTIWRRIEIPNTASFWDLHSTIQDIMGWSGKYLHQFDIPHSTTGKVEHIGIPAEEGIDDYVLPSWEWPLHYYVTHEGQMCTYTYRFSKGWSLKILLEKLITPESGIKYPRCVDGARAAPPEDCGGVAGYENLVDLMDDPHDQEYDTTVKSLGRVFDPEEFDRTKIRFSNPKDKLNYLPQLVS